MKIKGGALYYVVIFSLIISLLMCALILSTSLHRNQFNRGWMEEQLEDQLSSLTNVLLVKKDLPLNQSKNYFLMDSSIQLQAEKKLWGVYYLYQLNAQKGKIKKERCFLARHALSDSMALYTLENNKYLSLSGKTRITGDAYISRFGLRPSVLNGIGYDQSSLINGTLHQSSGNYPPIQDQFPKEQVLNALKGNFSAEDSVIGIQSLPAKHRQSFKGKTLLVFSTFIELDQVELSGRIVLAAHKKIRIGARSQLNNVVLMAPEIEIQSGFQGEIQVFATQHLTIHDQVQLNFPSVLGILKTESGFTALLHIGKSVQVHGNVLLIDPFSEENQVEIESDASLYGLHYLEGKVQLKGKVYGTLVCEKFNLKTPSTYYENHLHEVEISRKALSNYYVSTPLFQSEIPEKIIQWLD